MKKDTMRMRKKQKREDVCCEVQTARHCELFLFPKTALSRSAVLTSHKLDSLRG